MNVLFVTWDGPQVSYLESLFVPIFRQLQESGDVHFHVLQFTWDEGEAVAGARAACADAGIGYRTIQVCRWPRAFGALFTAFAGARHIRAAMRTHAIDVLMPRSTLPALSSLRAIKRHPCTLVFDADGLPLDERVDFAGESPHRPAHRLQRDIEAAAVRRANVVLVRSQRAIQILLARAGAGTAADKFHVVGNGRDAGLFRPGTTAERTRMRASIGIADDAPLLVYAGSLGAQYCMREMLALQRHLLALRADARLLVLTRQPEALADALAGAGLPDDSVLVRSATTSEVPRWLACADVGLALRQPSFSMQAVAPIKLGEYLLCGLPVVTSAGIGDSDRIDPQCRFLASGMEDADLLRAAHWIIDSVLPRREPLRDACRAEGERHFSLQAAVRQYRAALDALPLHGLAR